MNPEEWRMRGEMGVGQIVRDGEWTRLGWGRKGNTCRGWAVVSVPSTMHFPVKGGVYF